MSLLPDFAEENRGYLLEGIATPLDEDGDENLEFDEFREHFIPLRKAELIERLSNTLDADSHERAQFGNLCRLLESIFHFESHETLRTLKENYGPLDPDLALIDAREIDNAERDRRSDAFVDCLSKLLRQANYRELSREKIDEAINAATALGVRLRVNFDLFDRLHVFVRGDMIDKRTIRGLMTLYKKREIEVPVYQRLVVMFRLQDSDPKDQNVCDEHLYLKVFKNIPHTDLDMLLPGSKVKMTLLDQGRILIPTLSGIAVSLVKLVKAFALATLFAGVTGFFVFVGLLGGTIGYGVKSFFGYLRTKDKYQLSVTRHLYYQNLDNNAGVFFRILNEAEEQEFREAIVAYFLLWQEADSQGWCKSKLDKRAEALIKEMIDVDVDFEDEDALGKLERLGLAQCDKDGHWTAIGVDEALSKLDKAWDNYYQFHVHSD